MFLFPLFVAFVAFAAADDVADTTAFPVAAAPLMFSRERVWTSAALETIGSSAISCQFNVSSSTMYEEDLPPAALRAAAPVPETWLALIAASRSSWSWLT